MGEPSSGFCWAGGFQQKYRAMKKGCFPTAFDQ